MYIKYLPTTLNTNTEIKNESKMINNTIPRLIKSAYNSSFCNGSIDSSSALGISRAKTWLFPSTSGSSLFDINQKYYVIGETGGGEMGYVWTFF